jgi:hypothetical protein
VDRRTPPWWSAADTSQELEEERVPMSKGAYSDAIEAAENCPTYPAVTQMCEIAKEIRKDAASAGAPISEAKSLAKAMDQNPELKSAYYEGWY